MRYFAVTTGKTVKIGVAGIVPDDVVNCPNCDAEMDRQSLAGKYGPGVEVDLCFACHLIWLDKRESLQLSPQGTLDLFRALHEHRDDPRHALGARMSCPRCPRRLSLSHDIGKGGRFSYYACPDRDGRLTPFSEFLKEKKFVRELNPLERRQVSAEIKTVQCSGCGAPVDLERGFTCAHCGSAVTVLDADQVEKTLKELDHAAARADVDPVEAEMKARALASMEAMRTRPEDFQSGRAWRLQRSGRGIGVDLLSASLGVIFGDL